MELIGPCQILKLVTTALDELYFSSRKRDHVIQILIFEQDQIIDKRSIFEEFVNC